MNINRLYFFFSLGALLLLCTAYTNDNPYFRITTADVELKLPRNFPKPFYNFSRNKLNPDIFVLGRKLFYDNLLSKDNSVSCGTCHQRIAAFAHIDHKLSHGIYAKIGTRNVPALQNLIWKDTYMWDGGVNNLEVQPLNPITSPIEMDESLENIILKVKHDSTYVSAFKRAYKDSIINSERILKALAQFTGLMISANSRYDKFWAGKDTFSSVEKRGLEIFRNKCSGCHKEPLFTDNSYRNNGMKMDTSIKDKGRAFITLNKKDENTFKVPGLRNIVMTYPYMHDGRYRNLKEVIAHYSDPGNFKETDDPLLQKIGVISAKEQTELIAFLQTLTDKEFLYDRRFADPQMNY